MDNADNAITKEMAISDILAKYPQAAEIMQAYGLFCVGCHANAFDSLEGGVNVHGMPEETLTALLEELNAFVARMERESQAKGPQQQQQLTLTQAAADRIIELMKVQHKSGHGIRLEVLHGGCAGFMYNMDFAEREKEQDIVVEDKGVRLFVDKDGMPMLKGTEIDYTETLQESGFKINNPNAKSTCGCGKSFS